MWPTPFTIGENMEERAGRHCPQIVYTVSLLYYSLCVAQLANKKKIVKTHVGGVNY